MEENEIREIPLKLVCMACLCVGRTLRNITDEKCKQFYFDSLNDVSLCVTIPDVHVCWECEALLKKVVEFRKQVQDSYRTLQIHFTENTHVYILSDIVRLPHLVNKTLPSSSIPPRPRNYVKEEGKPEWKNRGGIEDPPPATENADAINVAIETLLSKAGRTRKRNGFENIERCPLSEDVSPSVHNTSIITVDTLQYDVKEEPDLSPCNTLKEHNYCKVTGTSLNEDDPPGNSNNVDAITEEIETLVSKAGRTKKKNGLENKERCPLSDDVSPSVHDTSIIAVDTLQYDVKEEEDSSNVFELSVSSDIDLDSDKVDPFEEESETLVSKAKKSKKGIKKKIKKSQKVVKKINHALKTKKGKKLDDKFITIELSYEEMLADREKEMKKDSYISSPHKCETCIIGFNYKNSYKAHLSHKHSEEGGDYICPICKCTILSVDRFTAHYKRHLRRFECSICQKRTMDIKVMEQHYYSTHHISLKEYKCDVCGKISNSIDTHRYHKDTHKARLQCTVCDKTFTHRAGLMNHRISVHELNSKFPCTVCDKVFRWKTSLKRHSEKHDLKDRSSAAYCGVCGITFASVCSYQRHMKNSLRHVSPDQLKYTCDDCKRRFSDKTKLRDHIEEKHLHRTFQCHICMKTSNNRVNLDQHIRNVHKGRPHNKLCHHCGKGFPTKVQLDSHIRTHTGERPFACDFCPTTFSQLSNLYKHNRQVHANIKANYRRYPSCKKKKEDKPPDPPPEPPLDPYRPVAVLHYSTERGTPFM